jgi:hypothetical protein
MISEVIISFDLDPFIGGYGVYLSADAEFQEIINRHSAHFESNSETLNMVITWDNATLWGCFSEGLLLKPTQLPFSQSPLLVHEIARYHFKEQTIPLSELIAKSGLDEVVGFYDGNILKSYPHLPPWKFLTSNDWISLINWS